MRSSFSVDSEVVKVTQVTPVTSIPGATQVPASRARKGLAILNQAASALSVYLCSFDKAAAQGPSVVIAAGGYWEDPRGYVGDVTLVSATTPGSNTINVTEWL